MKQLVDVPFGLFKLVGLNKVFPCTANKMYVVWVFLLN